MAILTLPTEVLEQLFTHLDPVEASRMSQCCQLLRQVLYDNQLIWRELYLRLPLDNPMRCVSMQGERRGSFDWKGAIQKFVRARTVLYSPKQSRPGEPLTTLQTLLDLITWTPPLTDIYDHDNISFNLAWVVAMLRNTTFFEDIELNDSTSDEERRLCAHIHTYFGLTTHDNTRAGRRRSRAFVYDMRKYAPDTYYGPLTPDERVNWVHVQAIHNTVSMHIVDFQKEDPTNYQFPIFPMSMQTTQIVLAPELNLDEEKDWVGPDEAGNLDSSIFDDIDYGEVYRTLNLDLKLVATTPDPKNPKRPIIHFAGEMPDTTSTMSGRIEMLADGQVQWKFISVPLVFKSAGYDLGTAYWGLGLQYSMIQKIQSNSLLSHFIRTLLVKARKRGTWPSHGSCLN
ncbi:hypothetical protein H0H92_016024 [Tricholoma furcatifolium]|nr:hypothetical protein H0H92_016024 [Tricholoma furcatifolium]